MDPLAQLIRALHDDGRLRVWSLVITVFGDSVQPRGGQVSTARLQRLLGRIGVEPGALRTALSRLSRDGWVEGTRTGRISQYRLTPSGRARFSDATSRIYAPPEVAPVTDWALSLDSRPDPALPAIAGLTLRPASAPPPETLFRMTGQIAQLAPELRATLLPAPHRAALDRLAQDLHHLTLPRVDPLGAAAARTLLIHRWRRLVLRFAEPPAALLPDPWPDLPPRAAVARTWLQLTPLAEAWWGSTDGDLPPLPAAGAEFARRFSTSGA